MVIFRNFPKLLGIACALVLAFSANYFFTGEWVTRFNDMDPGAWGTPRILGCISLLLAILAAAVTFGRSENFKALDTSSAPKRPIRWRWFIPAAICYATASFLYFQGGETSLIRWLWLGSIVLLIVPALGQFEMRDFWPLPFWEFGLLGIIVCAAFTLRYVNLTELPLHISGDVSIMGVMSRGMLDHHDDRWIGMAKTNHQFSEHQFLKLSMMLFGRDHYGLVMFSLLAGVASVVAVYFLGKIACNRWVGFAAASFLATNYVHIHFSRTMFGPIATFFLLVGLLFLIHGIRTASLLSFIAGGCGIGGALLDYYSGRVAPLVGLGLFAVWFIARKRYPKIPIAYWGMSVAAALAVFGPNLTYGMVHAKVLHGRGNEVILWTDMAWKHSSGKYNAVGEPTKVLQEQASRSFLSPYYYPDESTLCYLRKPMLGSVEAALSLIGLGFCLRRLFKPESALPYLWIVPTLVCGGMLTIDPPFWPHLNIALPAFALLAGIGMERCIRRFSLAFASRRAVGYLAVGSAAVLVLSGLHNWEVYVRFVDAHASGRVHAMRQIQKLSPEYRVVFVSPEIKWRQETFGFFAADVDAIDLSEAKLLESPPVITKPTVFFLFEGTSPETLQYMIKLFPSSFRTLILDGWNYPVFTMVRVLPPGYVEHPQDFQKPPLMLWTLPGWWLLSATILWVMCLGWQALCRDIRPQDYRKIQKA